MSKKMIVLGGGPGGYVTAIRAAQLGAEVHIIENENFGGTCLNVGCIPTKALLHSAELYEEMLHANSAGIQAENVTVQWDKVLANKQAIVNKLVNGVGGLLRANKVTIHRGFGVLQDSHTVVVNGSEKVKGDIIIVATGSRPSVIPFPGHDLPGVINSTDALSLSAPPKSMLIVGGGVIGVEFASLFATFGCKVTVVELLPEILPMVDGEIAAELKKELSAKGVVFHTDTKLLSVAQKGDMLSASLDCKGAATTVEAQYVLVAVGRSPATQGIGLEHVGIATQRGKIPVDKNFATSQPNIYAIGDCNGILMLAHAASAQGIAAVEHALGHESAYYPNTIPSCIYTNPEIAWVGLTQEQAKQQGYDVQVGSFNLSGNGKTLIANGGKGIMKFVTDKKYGQVLGVQMYGPRVTDIISEAALAIRLEATVEEIISTIHPHPTISEGVAEAALAVNSIAIHWPPKQK